MNNRLAKEEAIDQVFSAVELENVVENPESLSDFLDLMLRWEFEPL